MITIEDSNISSSFRLSDLLMNKKKNEMLEICDRLDLYVNPYMHKQETANKVAKVILGNSADVLRCLDKEDLDIIVEFEKGGEGSVVIRKIRKTEYKLQKYCMVLTLVDVENEEWKMKMPEDLRKAFKGVKDDN